MFVHMYVCTWVCALFDTQCDCVSRENESSSEVIVTHKAAGIVVAHRLGIAEGLKQWV